jgi:hypothetical protein
MKIRSSRRASIIGIVSGLFFGLLGLVSGVYFGIVKPAIEAGKPVELPFSSIGVMLVIMLSVVVTGIFVLRNQQSATDLNDKWK